MYKKVSSTGLVSVFFSCGSKPLATWTKQVQNGYIRRITDETIKSLVLEMMSANIINTYISTPACPNESLGIKLPFMVIIVKNMKKYFSFEVTVLDDRQIKRRFRISNYQRATRIKDFCCNMPLGLNPAWNQIQFNLADFTKQAYGADYVETMRVTVHANCRLRRIYFSDRLRSNDELPESFQLLVPP